MANELNNAGGEAATQTDHIESDLYAWQDRARQFEVALDDAQLRATAAEESAVTAAEEERVARLSADALAAELRLAMVGNDEASIGADHNAAVLAQMRASMSWRITAPLRKVAPLIPPWLLGHARRIVKAVWWTITPWRTPERMRFVKARRAAAADQVMPNPDSVGVDYPMAPIDGRYADWIAGTEFASRPVTPRSEGAPLVSFLILAGGSATDIAQTLGSIQGQRHRHWEVIVCGPPTANASAVDFRVRSCATSEIGGGNAAFLATAVGMAKGEFIALLDAGDLLSPTAINEIVAALARSPFADIFYGDEDEQSSAGVRGEPYFKPGWSPDLLFAFNYFGRLTLLSRLLVTRVSASLDASDAIEWDLNLRVSEQAQTIERIPKILCHRRPGGHRDRPAPASDVAICYRRVIERHWTRLGFKTNAVSQADGTQRAVFQLDTPPLVSVVIPTRNKPELLRMCLDGLLTGTDYSNKEIVIVDTGSDDPETLAYYKELANHAEVRIVYFRKKFNYSAACNFGAARANGELLLFLNNDIEVVSRDWLSELVSFAVRPGVGVVGTKLVYPSRELQHAGVGVGIHLCALMYKSAKADEWGVFGSADHPRNWLAIMGACQLVRRNAFEQVGGFDESYLIAMSDVALCLRIWRAGFRTAYAPHACLVHHEGATRGNTNPVEDVQRIADDIRFLGVDEDPYLHPELDGHTAIPTLRLGNVSTVRQILRAGISEYGSPVLPERVLNLSDDGACLITCAVSRDRLFWLPQSLHCVDDKWSAARWCLDLLRTRPDLRLKYPRALSEGLAGGFARWLLSQDERGLVLPAGFRAALEALFADDLAARARQAFMCNGDIRSILPQGLTPIGRAGLLRWFARRGRSEFGLRLEEIWWLFWESAENPERELVRAYKFTPAWQQLYPDAMTVFGRRPFAAWFSATYRVSESWVQPERWPLDLTSAQQLRIAYRARDEWQTIHPQALNEVEKAQAFIAWLQSPASMQSEQIRIWCASLDVHETARQLTAPGVNVIGHFCYPSGLRVSVEALVGGLQQVGVATSLRDLRTDKKDDPQHVAFDGFEEFDVTIVHMQPEPFFDDAYRLADLYERLPRTYRIAYWYWEFDSIPDAWVAKATQVDEVWAATEFVAKGLREKLSIPVRTLFPGVKLGAYQRRERAYFGLQEGAYTFLFTFHMMSIMERKNPLGLIRAFKEAFASEEPVSLVLKTSFGDRHPAQLAELRVAAVGSNITIIDQVYSPDEVLSLMDSCDAYVSLHRSEGLGLTMAEAMLMGKPVIATNYSGNVDFMDETNSLLVPYKLVKLGRPIPPYAAESEWAEPSIEHAAKLMRRVYEDQVWSRAIGERAKISANTRLSLKQAGIRIAQRLDEIKVESRIRQKNE